MTEGNHPDKRELSPGTVIDRRYEVKALIGSGGFAMVYRVADAKTGRDVALKLLDVDPDLMDLQTYRARFVREAEVATRIDHPHCVRIHDFGVAGKLGLPFLVMELLEGRDLDEEIRYHGALAPDRAMKLFMPVLEALGRGHELGIIHRDLKPENLYLCNPGSDDERLVLLDFGVAKLDDKTAVRLTVTGQLFGTPVFAAPEWIRHQIATPALDVYQIGLILVEALSGEAVIREENPFECLNIHCQARLELPVDLLYGPFGPIFSRALALDHEARFPDANALRAALVDVDLAGLPAKIKPGPRRSLIQPAGSRPTRELAGAVGAELFDEERGRQRTPMVTWVALGVAVLALAAVVTVVAWVITRDEPQANAAVVTEPTQSDDEARRPATPAEREISPTAPDPEAVAALVVTVQSRPEGATLFDGAERLGETPMRITFGSKDDAARELRIELQGHDPATVTVTPESGPLVTTELTLHGSPGDGPSPRDRRKRKAAEDGMEVLP